MIDVFIIGLLLGGSYALIAMGLQLQYGVARIMNLANGEFLVAGSFGAFWLFTGIQLSPILSIFLVVPLAFGFNWLIYQCLLRPLVKRAKSQGQLEVDSILATFGISFIMVGLMLAVFGGEFFNYSYLAVPVHLLGNPYALNRIAAFVVSLLVGSILYFWLYRTRSGMTLRATAVSPQASLLVGINVPLVLAVAFSLGGAITAAGGALLSMFLTFDASIGVVFTMKALIIVIMGGVGDLRGAIIAAFILGLAETMVASWVDPGLTLAAAYLLFILILLFKPHGLFGRQSS
jgi:branched-chain amino acid transport system permease protein